jgi:hypothetical protein
MPALSPTLGTVNIDCPRPECGDAIICDVHGETEPPKPGATSVKMKMRVTDFADKMAAHYRDAHGITV